MKALIEGVASDPNAKPGSAAQKVGDLYRSYTNLAKRNEAGLSPIKPLLDELQKVDSMESLCQVMGKHHRFGVSAPLGVYVSVDARNSDRYITYADQDGLSLPDRDYYLVDEPQYVKLREELASYAADLLTAIQFQDAAAKGKAIVNIETALAKNQWTKTENRDPVKTYNLRSSSELQELFRRSVGQRFAKHTA